MAVTGAGADPAMASETAYGHIAYEVDTQTSQQVGTNETEQVVRNYFSDIPIMIEVARCESTFRHTLADGSVLTGVVDSDDTGVMQINKRYHLDRAIELGLDLEDIYDNMAYARYLYEKQGVQPWSASAPCWGGHMAYNQ